jgi:hypothetical protein
MSASRRWRRGGERDPSPLGTEVAALPLALLRAFLQNREPDPREEWKRLLLFLSPITLAGGLKIAVSR